ncbi:MAG TPA: potassium-transporting ATPase subunit KdpB [Polyangiaceae bacterium]|nr:potassium-transporting ATPase subunit KdpB [Polyangiaceae bacterium]
MSKSKENSRSLFDPAIIKPAIGASFKKLNPRDMMKNPVMFVVEVGTALVTVLYIADLWRGHSVDSKLTLQLIIWLWFTVLFANFAEAVAEGRGKAQAATLRKMRTTTNAFRTRLAGGSIPLSATGEGRARGELIAATDLEKGDQIYVKAGELIPADGEILEGVASVDESAITGESAPVVREAGGDRSAVTGGTRVLSDWLVIEVRQDPGGGFIDRMISLVEGAQRQKTPNEIALTILLAGLTIIFLAATAGLIPSARFFAGDISILLLVSLLVCLIPTTIGALLSAIGIAGMDRLVQYNVIATSGRAVEAAGDIDVLMLDKTGTITYGSRQAFEMVAANGVDIKLLAEVAMLSSLSDETPEGKSIVTLAEKTLAERLGSDGGTAVPFTAQTRMSGLDLGSRVLRKGATDAVVKHVTALGGSVPQQLLLEVKRIANEGGTPLVVSEGPRALGVVYLKDTVKPGMRERFERLRAMGIKTVMITGDNPLTAKKIAEEAGVDDFLAEATPETKMAYIERMQEGGRLVAMTGDGTNDAPALARADVGVAMNTGTQAAKEAGNMVDLDSDPTKLIEIVEIGKQLLMTRGALTTFSVANDLAKYFTILPAMLTGIAAFQLAKGDPHTSAFWSLNIMELGTPSSAILSAVIFNALIIIALIPLALRGVKYRPMGVERILRRNLLVYGGGGVLLPFVGIKLIDLIVNVLHLA